MTRPGQRYAWSAGAAVGLHAVFATALWLADVQIQPAVGDETEVALEEAPPEPVTPEPEIEPETEPETEPEIEPETKPEPVQKVEPRPEPRQTPPPETSAPETPSTDEPAPGAPSPVTPGGMIQMDDLAPAGTMKVRPGSGKSSGPGGPGGGTGGGGTGEGTAPAKPVSIASIKRRAMPIGDTDYTNLGKDYPPEALKRRVEGDVVVKLIVDAKGAVTSRKIVKGPGFGLNKRALALARKLRFEPAIDANDRPVTSVVVWTFTFALPD